MESRIGIDLGGTKIEAIALAAGAFAFCFAVFGSLSAMMPILSKQIHLSPVQKSLAVALPVLLGSLGCIPLGMLTDRFRGRSVFSFVMLISIIPAFLMGTVHHYQHLLISQGDSPLIGWFAQKTIYRGANNYFPARQFIALFMRKEGSAELAG